MFNDNDIDDNDINILAYNLDQGKKILDYNNSFHDTTSPNLELISQGDIVEAMSNYNLSKKDKEMMSQIKNIEKIFNRTLTEYNNTYKEFNEDLLARNKSKKQIMKYLGKNANFNGKIAYVNNFGYTNWYPNWNNYKNRHDTCQLDIISNEHSLDDIDKFKVGANIIKGQPCGVAGKIIRNTKTNQYAWVDIKGYKHIFPRGKNMSQSCREHEIMDLSPSDYNRIPSGKSMTKQKECLALDVDLKLWNKLKNINNKLNRQANKLYKDLHNLHSKSDIINKHLQKQKAKMQQHIIDIDNDNKKLLYTRNMLMQLSGEEEDSSLRMNANYYGYLVWIFLMILILSLMMKIYLGEASNYINPILYLIAVIFVLIFIVYLYNK